MRAEYDFFLLLAFDSGQKHRYKHKKKIQQVFLAIIVLIITPKKNKRG